MVRTNSMSQNSLHRVHHDSFQEDDLECRPVLGHSRSQINRNSATDIENSVHPRWKMQILRIGSPSTKVCPCKFGSKCLGVILVNGASQHIINDCYLLYSVRLVPPVSVHSALKQRSVVKDVDDLAMKLENNICLK